MRSIFRRPAFGALLLLGVLGAFWGLLMGQMGVESTPGEIVPIAWDQETCGHCGMHISDPKFAVQLRVGAGSVLNFDDPGCFFAYVAERRPAVQSVFFHHHAGEQWLRSDRVGFVRAAKTPMGYGFGAVAAGNDALTMSYDDLLAQFKQSTRRTAP